MKVIAVLLAVAAAYWVGRDAEWREWMREGDPGPEDEMDAVQPADDWVRRVLQPSQTITSPNAGWLCSYGHRHSGADTCVMN